MRRLENHKLMPPDALPRSELSRRYKCCRMVGTVVKSGLRIG